MNNQEKMRTFIACPIPENVLEKIFLIQERLKQFHWKIRWVPLSNIHLTLSFLGDIDPALQQDIEKILVQLVNQHHSFNFSLGHLGVFPNPRRPSVIWIGLLGDTQALIQFQKKLQLALEPLGFPLDKRSFKAHLTLGRVKSQIPGNELAEMLAMKPSEQECRFICDRIVFFQSILSPKGAKYYSLSKWMFNGYTKQIE